MYVDGTGLVLADGQVGFYLHVDDGVLAGSRRDPYAEVENLLHTAAASLVSIGFVVDDRRKIEDKQKVIGYIVQSQPVLLRPPGSKLATLHLGLEHQLSQERVHIEQLRPLTGIWLWFMLLNRNLLSLAHSLFQFLERCEGQTVMWWPSAWF